MAKDITTKKAKDLFTIRNQINFIYSRGADGKYLQIPEKVNDALSRKLLMLRRALKPLDETIDGLRETHLEKGDDGNFKVTESGQLVYKQESSRAILEKQIKEIEDQEISVDLGTPITWKDMLDTKVNGTVLVELCDQGVVADPED